MLGYEEKINLVLNETIKSFPLFETWLLACNVRSYNGKYGTVDVCNCMEYTTEDIRNIRQFEQDAPTLLTSTASKVLPLKTRLAFDAFLEDENAHVEVEKAVSYGRLMTEIDSSLDTLTLNSLINRYDSYGSQNLSSEYRFRRLCLALSIILTILCSVMEAKFGQLWIDEVYGSTLTNSDASMTSSRDLISVS